MSQFYFEYINEKLIDRLLKCSLCSKALLDPVKTANGDPSCRNCAIENASKVYPDDHQQQSSFIQELNPIQDRIVLDMLDSLLVKCTKCDKTNTRRLHIEEHLKQECPKRIVSCIASDLRCPWSGPYQDSIRHIAQCTFQLLRPILADTVECRKQLEQYKKSSEQQQRIIEQLTEQIKLHENRIEKFQKGQSITLGLLSKQSKLHEQCEEKFAQIQAQLDEQRNIQTELKTEFQQLKEMYSNISNTSNESQSESNQSNEFEQLSIQFKQQLDECQNKMQELKVQFDERMIQLNEYEHTIKSLPELEKSLKDEMNELEKNVHQHHTQISLLFNKLNKSNVIVYNPKIDALIQPYNLYGDINLVEKNINDEEMDFLCKKAMDDKKCRSLQLEQNNITSKGAKILAEKLRDDTNLVKLNLSKNNISDAGVLALTQVLSNNNRTLEDLVLESNEITDKGAEYLADMLKTNETLLYLALGSNSISNPGIRSLLSAITFNNRRLEHLSLSSSNLIDDGCLNALLEFLQHHQSLHVLSLNKCGLSTDAIEKLQEIAVKKRNFLLITE